MLDNYEININTLAIIPVKQKLSRVIEKDNIYLVSKSTTSIIDNSCRYFGCSLDGRHKGTKEMIGVSYKSPIIIEETNNIIFFPTSSPRFDDCYWICLNNIKKSIKNNNSSQIIFNNNYELNLNISYESLNNQILRATLLDSTLTKRKKC